MRHYPPIKGLMRTNACISFKNTFVLQQLNRPESLLTKPVPAALDNFLAGYLEKPIFPNIFTTPFFILNLFSYAPSVPFISMIFLIENAGGGHYIIDYMNFDSAGMDIGGKWDLTLWNFYFFPG